jgi:hypothetical protein
MEICKHQAPQQLEVEPGHYVVCHLFNEDMMKEPHGKEE